MAIVSKSSKQNNRTTIVQTEENNLFLQSLDELSVEDVVSPERRKSKKKLISTWDLMRVLVILVCVAVFALCFSELAQIFEDYQRGDDIYDPIKDKFFDLINGLYASPVEQMVLAPSDRPMHNYADILSGNIPVYPNQGVDRVNTSLRFRKLLTFIEGLKVENPDTYGYIYIPNSKIAYPLVQSTDNNYYLNHSFYGTELNSGAIYVDFRNADNVEHNQNIVIYGHNMMNGSMFYDVTKYMSEDFFYNNDIVEITTFDGLYTFQVFSAYPTTKYDDYFSTHFINDEMFMQFCEKRRARSLYVKEGITFTPEDTIITFSTCITGNPDGRYAVHAKLIKVET